MEDILGLTVEVEEDPSFGAQSAGFSVPTDRELEVVISVVAASLFVFSSFVLS
jgi:hypothetical protein